MGANFEIRTTGDADIDQINLGVIDSGMNTISTVRVYNSGDATPTTLNFGAALINWKYTGGTNAQGQEAITETWVEAKEGAGAWTPIGGATLLAITPPTAGNYTTILLRLNVPVGFSTAGNASVIPFVEFNVE